MAKIPDYTALGQTPAPVPESKVVNATIRPVEPYPAGEGMVALGHAEQNFAADLMHEQGRQDNLRAESAWTNLRIQQNELSYGKDGFTQIKGQDAVSQPLMKIYGDKLATASSQIAGGLDNENQRTMFAQRAGISSMQMKEDILKHVDAQKTVQDHDVLQGTLMGERLMASQRFSQPDAEVLPILRSNAAIEAYARQYGKPKEWVAEMQQKAKDGIYGDMIKTQIVSDPDAAWSTLMAHHGEISGAEWAALDSQVVSHQYMTAMRDWNNEQRKMHALEHDLALDQNRRSADMWARQLDPTKDKPAPSDHEIAVMVGAQGITREQGMAILNLRKDGPENAIDRINAIQMAHDPDLTVAAKNARLAQLINQHKINAATATLVQDAIYAIDQRGETAEQRGIFESMSAIMGGHNVDMGLIHLDNSQERLQAELWGQAREEWTRRVIVGKEDPTQVRNSILNRYSQNTELPTWLKQPKYGAVTNMKDFDRVHQKTIEMGLSGDLTEKEFVEQNDLLVDYQHFFQQQQAKQDAIRQMQQSAPKTPKSGASKLQQPATVRPGANADDTAKIRGVKIP